MKDPEWQETDMGAFVFVYPFLMSISAMAVRSCTGEVEFFTACCLKIRTRGARVFVEEGELEWSMLQLKRACFQHETPRSRNRSPSTFIYTTAVVSFFFSMSIYSALLRTVYFRTRIEPNKLFQG